MEQNLDKNKENDKDMEISNLADETWVKRLDLAFDQSNSQGIQLKEQEIAEYVEFNKKYLKNIDEFIQNVKRLGYLFICEPDLMSYEDVSFFESIPMKAEIVLSKLHRIEFRNVSITNYGYGDPNKINDVYELNLESSKGKFYNYELTGLELIRFYFQGSIVHKDGDIIAINVQKAMDTLNKYYL